MPFLSVFYCPLPVFYWITHIPIIFHLLLVFKWDYYIISKVLSSNMTVGELKMKFR